MVEANSRPRSRTGWFKEFGKALEPAVVMTSALAIVVGFIGGLVAQGLARTHLSFYEYILLREMVVCHYLPGSSPSRGMGYSHTAHRRPAGRHHGLLLGAHAEGAWDPRSHGSRPGWKKPGSDAGRDFEATGHGLCHWHWRAFRSGRAHHPNRSGIRLHFRPGDKIDALPAPGTAGFRRSRRHGSDLRGTLCRHLGGH